MGISTDLDRRLAAQLVIQLPADLAEARRVLALTSEMLEGFLVEQPAINRVAQSGWGGASTAAAWIAGARLTSWQRAGVTISFVLLSLALACLVAQVLGAGGTVTLSFLAIATSLLFGAGPGLAMAAFCLVANNLLFVPPALELTIPTKMEFLFGVYLVLVVLSAPTLARISPLRRGDPGAPPPAPLPHNVEPLRRISR